MVPETLKEGKALRPIRSSQKYMTEDKRFTSFQCGAYMLQDLCHMSAELNLEGYFSNFDCAGLVMLSRLI